MDMQRRYENLLSENQRLISEIDILRQQLTKPADVTCKSTLKRLAIQQADDTISVSKGEWEAVSKDAERFMHIANFERVTGTCKFAVQVIGDHNNYYMEYFKCEKPYKGAEVLHETKLDALRAGVDKAIQGASNG
jgi:cell division septum initiation protein DivIVA